MLLTTESCENAHAFSEKLRLKKIAQFLSTTTATIFCCTKLRTPFKKEDFFALFSLISYLGAFSSTFQKRQLFEMGFFSYSHTNPYCNFVALFNDNTIVLHDLRLIKILFPLLRTNALWLKKRPKLYYTVKAI